MDSKKSGIEGIIKIISVVGMFIVSGCFLLIWYGVLSTLPNSNTTHNNFYGYIIVSIIFLPFSFFSGYMAWRLGKKNISKNGATNVPTWFFWLFGIFIIFLTTLIAFNSPHKAVIIIIFLLFTIFSVFLIKKKIELHEPTNSIGRANAIGENEVQ